MSQDFTTRTFTILNTNITDFTMTELLDEISAAVRGRTRSIFAHHNLHSLYLNQSRPRFQNFYEQMVSYAPIDGMPLIWIARLYGYRIERDRRLTYVDFLPHLLKRAQTHGWRIFYVGSSSDVCETGIRILSLKYPGVELEAMHGYFDVDTQGIENRNVLARISDFKPDILLVGMGMPRQEEWIAANRMDLDAGVILPCGAAIDYFAGAVPTPPRWAGRLGLEWLFRLCSEPRRLGHRYMIEPWFLVLPLIVDLIQRD